MKFVKTSIYLIFIFILFTGFNSSKDWYTLIASEFDYQVEYPLKPRSLEREINSEVGKLKMNIFLLDMSKSKKSQNLFYMSNYTEYPKEGVSSDKKELLDDFFNGAINGAVKNVQGKLISKKTIQYKEYPGRYIKIDFRNGLAIITMKIILVKNKMYMLQTITETKKDFNTSITRFMKSFKLLSDN